MAKVPDEEHDAVKAGCAKAVTSWACHCVKCGHDWVAHEIPTWCSSCKSINWWIKRGRGRPPGSAREAIAEKTRRG